MKFRSSSEDESKKKDQRIETTADGTVWEEIEESSKLGKAPLHDTFRKVSDPTRHAKIL